MSGEYRGATQSSPRLLTTSQPSPPNRPRSSVYSTIPPNSKRIRVGGSPEDVYRDDVEKNDDKDAIDDEWGSTSSSEDATGYEIDYERRNNKSGSS